MPAKAFERLVEAGHTQLRVIKRSRVQVSDLLGACELLGILSHANEARCRRERHRIVPFESLYHHDVSDSIHVDSDYERWVRSQRREGQDIFSFINYPFLLSPAAKSSYLSVDARLQQLHHARQALADGRRRGLLGRARGDDDAANPHFVIEVSRANIVEETLQRIVNVSPKWQLKKPLKVKFKGEAGVDEGGVRKEFFQVMTRQLFTIDYGMFIEEAETNTLWFNHDSDASPVQWELLGSLLGLAIYNGIILDVQFPTVVYRQLTDEPPTLRDLAEFRPSVASSLKSVLDYSADDIEDVMCLDFTASYESWGEAKTQELIPGGAKIAVTQDNKHEYIRLYIKFVLVDLVNKQLGSFKRGFENVASGHIIDMFRPEEMELLVVGSKELDFAALREAAVFEEPYTPDTPVIQWLWEVVLDELTEDERRKFLAFTTGSDRAPIRGLGSVKMAISRAGPDSDHLPTAHTCFSHLLLPDYSSKDKLRNKLKAAIVESEGFGLM
jgi:ubiquitin-protein ligase E3 A